MSWKLTYGSNRPGFAVTPLRRRSRRGRPYRAPRGSCCSHGPAGTGQPEPEDAFLGPCKDRHDACWSPAQPLDPPSPVTRAVRCHRPSGRDTQRAAAVWARSQWREGAGPGIVCAWRRRYPCCESLTQRSPWRGTNAWATRGNGSTGSNHRSRRLSPSHATEHLGFSFRNTDAGGPLLAGTVVYIRVKDVDGIAKQFDAEVVEMPWAREVCLSDPDGNRLRIGTPRT